jgi:CRISPR-associated protein Cas1
MAMRIRAVDSSGQISTASSYDQGDLPADSLNFRNFEQHFDNEFPAASPEPLLRIESLHAMKYCERLFYFQEVEQISVAHPDVYAGRRLHDDVVSEEDISPEKRSFQVESETWGLTTQALHLCSSRGIPVQW